MDIGTYRVLVLRFEERDWKFEGKEGTAYILHFLEQGNMFKAKVSKELYEAWKDTVQTELFIDLKLSVFGGVCKLVCVGITESNE